MEEFWARLHMPPGLPGPDYWTYFAERLVHHATIPGDAIVLDIGTCDGNVLFKAMEKTRAQGYGIGIDIDSCSFPAGAAYAMKREWKEKIAFVRMDGNVLGFPAEAFHTVLANFVGWDDCFDFKRMKFIGPDRMTPEIMRVLKPGGQVGIGSWVEQCDIDWLAETFKKYLPVHGRSISCYSRENPESYKLILQSNGFINVHTHVETSSFISSDAETWWKQINIAAREYFERGSDLDKAEFFKKQVFSDLEQFRSPEGICFSKTVSHVIGTKPG